MDIETHTSNQNNNNVEQDSNYVEQDSNYVDDIRQAIEISQQEYEETTNSNFEKELEDAIVESRNEFNVSRSILEKDLLDNFNKMNTNDDNTDIIPGENTEYWYKVRKMTSFPWYSATHDALQYSNQVIMPHEILQQLFPTQTDNQDQYLSDDENSDSNSLYPQNIILSFTLKSSSGNTMVVTPSEFIFTDNVFIPDYIMNNMNINEDDYVCLEFNSQQIMVGTKVVFSPNEPEFLKVKDLKSMLELSLMSSYKCIQNGDIIKIFSHELSKELTFTIKNTEPENIIDITHTDLEVDFDINPEFYPKPSPSTFTENKINEDKRVGETEKTVVESKGYILGSENKEIISSTETPEEKKDRMRKARLARFGNKSNL